ncbi:MAG: glycosyltransferase family 2 protein [bacterium]
MNSSNSCLATAILAVYNGAATIRQALDTLLTQSVPVEIIVVDDGSTDTTLKILKEYKQVKVLKQGHQGPALARNLGAQKASSDILLFVDADMSFDKNYVKELIVPIQEGEAIGTYTTEEKVSNWDNVWARCWNIEEGWEKQKRFPKSPPKFGTDFRSILNSEFDRVGGFYITG